MRISVLAWGSIISDRRNLAIIGDFEPTGPGLPVEFCRISADGRLTLVIDESFGTPCVTYSALSAFDNLDAAIENLRAREGMPTPKGVGFTVGDGSRQSASAIERHPHAAKNITAWVNANGLDAAIWAALGSNFAEKANEPFSVEAAIRYLQMLNGEPREGNRRGHQSLPDRMEGQGPHYSVCSGLEADERRLATRLRDRRSCQ